MFKKFEEKESISSVQQLKSSVQKGCSKQFKEFRILSNVLLFTRDPQLHPRHVPRHRRLPGLLPAQEGPVQGGEVPRPCGAPHQLGWRPSLLEVGGEDVGDDGDD